MGSACSSDQSPGAAVKYEAPPPAQQQPPSANATKHTRHPTPKPTHSRPPSEAELKKLSARELTTGASGVHDPAASTRGPSRLSSGDPLDDLPPFSEPRHDSIVVPEPATPDGQEEAKDKARRPTAAQLLKLKTSCLKASVFSECLTLEQIECLAQHADMKKWSKIGDRIFEQGSSADAFYVVHKGEILLEVHDAALDNSANQAQVARMLAEEDLTPLTDESGNATHIGASLAVPSSPHGASEGSTEKAPGYGTRQKAPLTRAELVALEAAALIDQEAVCMVTPPEKADPKSKQHSKKASENLGPDSSPATRHPSAPSTQRSLAPDVEVLAITNLPSTYTTPNTMFMCVKSATHTFGADMFFAHGKHMTSAVNNALSTHLLVLPRAAFDALWLEYPDTRGPIMKHLGEFLEDSLLRSNWLSNAQVVAPHKLTTLTSLFHQASVPAGTLLFEEGDICNDDSPLYFILEGSVELTFTNERGHKLTKVLEKGALFGELGVLLGFAITATAMTVGDCIFRMCKRRWLNLFTAMVPQLLPTLRSLLSKNYHVRDEQLLENPEVQNAFTEFCLQSFSAENVEFWSAVISFRKVVFPALSHNIDDVLTEAAGLYNRFISETAVLQINIKQGVRASIKEMLQEGEVTKDLFVDAEREICQLMLQDTFLRFKSTPLFTQAMSLLHAPSPRPILLNYANVSSHAPQYARAKGEYSRTTNSARVTTVGTAPARHVQLDDAAVNSLAVHVPLMFGGGTRATPAANRHSAGRIHVHAPHNSASSAEISPNPLLLTPQHLSTGSAHFLSTPTTGGQLTLSPGTDKFRLSTGDSLSPSPSVGSTQNLARKRSFVGLEALSTLEGEDATDKITALPPPEKSPANKSERPPISVSPAPTTPTAPTA